MTFQKLKGVSNVFNESWNNCLYVVVNLHEMKHWDRSVFKTIKVILFVSKFIEIVSHIKPCVFSKKTVITKL